MSRVAVVAIGRNEGERLVRCLQSVIDGERIVVYVDSGSTDGSVERARQLGAEVVELPRDIPFTAARARNAGCARLLEITTDVEFVQFVDGDCEVVAGWLDLAVRALATEPLLAVVAGRRRERHPQQTIYNQLCDIEWDTPCGEVRACGGDCLARVCAMREVGWYDPTLIAGEEPELCVRLRKKGWKIRRVQAEMTLHDAAMTRFSQWWRRTVRAGHAYAEGAALHGRSPERHWLRESRSIWFWGIAVPLMGVLLAWPTQFKSLGLFAGYPLLVLRVYHNCRRRALPPSIAWRYSLFTVVGKFPQAIGQLTYLWNRLLQRSSRLIEYKGAAT